MRFSVVIVRKTLISEFRAFRVKTFSSKRGLFFYGKGASQGGGVAVGFLLKIPGGGSLGEGWGICVKWVPFVKLAFSPGSRAHFGSKVGLFLAFPHYVFNDCGPTRGFYSDFDLSPILTL